MPRQRIDTELRDKPLNLKITDTHKAKLDLIVKSRNSGSVTQAIIQLIDEDFAARGLTLPKHKRLKLT